MNTVVNKIRAEIDRLQETTMDAYHNFTSDYNQGFYDGLSQLELFIDSLPEEKKPIRQYVSPEDSTLGKLLKEMKDFSPQEDLGISNEEYNDFVNELIFGKEKPISEDLEEAANDYAHDIVHDDVFENFIAGANWQKEQILGNDNKQYHRLRHETLKRLYENEAKLELMLDKALEGYIEKYEQIGGHNYLSLKIPMLSKPDDCKDGDKIKLIILKENK